MERSILTIISTVVICYVVIGLGASVFIAVIWASNLSTYNGINAEMLTAVFLTLGLMPGGIHILMPRLGENISKGSALMMSGMSSMFVLVSLVIVENLSSLMHIIIFGILVTISSFIAPIGASAIRQMPFELRQSISESKSTTLIIGAVPWIYGLVISMVSLSLDVYGVLSLVWLVIFSFTVLLLSIGGMVKATKPIVQKNGDFQKKKIKGLYTPTFKLLLFATVVYYFCYGVFEIGMIQYLASKSGEMASIGMFWAFFTIGAASIMLLQINYQYSNHLGWIAGIILSWSIAIILFPLARGWQILLLAFVLGGTFAPYAIICNTYINKITSPSNRNATYKIWSSILLFPTPIGLIFGGYVITALDDEFALILSGIAMMGLATLLFYLALLIKCI